MPWVQTDRSATPIPESGPAEVSTWNIAGAALPKVLVLVNCPSTGGQTSHSSSSHPTLRILQLKNEMGHRRKPRAAPGLQGAKQRRANQIM